MLARFRSGLSYANVMATVAVFLTLGGGALAATSFVGSDGKLHGCVSKKGQLTVLKGGKTKCAKGLTAISWSQTAPRGLTGAQGPKGDQGVKGDTGPSTGPAGGALAGTYPNPTLNVSGGPCARGKFLTDLSNLSALTCGPPATLTAFGDNALASNTTGIENTAVGRNALKSNTSPCCNTAVGEVALEKSTACCNTATGDATLADNTAGVSNSAFGEGALTHNTTGSNNSVVGEAALQLNTTTSNNSAVGQAALEHTTGNNNSALGQNALQANTTGTDNTAVGKNALGNATADSNSAFGRDALSSTSGGNNIAVGKQAGNNLTIGSDNIDIGNLGVAGESGAIRIGTPGSQTKAFLAGVNGTGVDQNTPVLVGTDGKLGTMMSSSRRFKTDIHPLGPIKRLMRLRPVSYRYKPRWAGGDRRVRYGLIAEEAARTFPALVQYGPDGKPNGVRYGDLPVLLLAQLQREHRKNDRQQRQIHRLNAQVRALARRH